MNTDSRNRAARIARLRRVAAAEGIELTAHPSRDLAPLFARDEERFTDALRRDEDATLAREAAEDAQNASFGRR